MKLFFAAAAILGSIVLSAPGGQASQPQVPVEMEGNCRGSGIGQSFLRSHKAQGLPRPDCNLAVSIGDASLSFFKAGETIPKILFSGRRAGATSFDVELVRIADEPLRAALSGKCMRAPPYFIMCYAVFEEDGVRKGVALSFDLKRPPAR